MTKATYPCPGVSAPGEDGHRHICDITNLTHGIYAMHYCPTCQQNWAWSPDAEKSETARDTAHIWGRSYAAGGVIGGNEVNHPDHYTQHPSGVECITVVEHMSFNVGNAVKYLWRAGLKGSKLDDLRKAAWYVNREIERLEGASEDGS
jgi:hypothetical protein